jgi:hypothetical protein
MALACLLWQTFRQRFGGGRRSAVLYAVGAWVSCRSLLGALPLLDIVNVRMAFICDDARCQIKTDKLPLLQFSTLAIHNYYYN